MELSSLKSEHSYSSSAPSYLKDDFSKLWLKVTMHIQFTWKKNGSEKILDSHVIF